MANKSKSMLQVSRILQLLSDGYSNRETNRLTGVSRNTIDVYEVRFQRTGKNFNDLLQLSDSDFAAIVYPKETTKDRDPRRKYLSENQDYYLKELKRKGVTRELLWQEYRQEQPEGYMYSQFCKLLSKFSSRNPVYHNTYVPGEILEIDFAGSKMSHIDRPTGEIIECLVLVCTMAYSSFS